MNLHLYKVIFTIELCLLQCLYSYRFYIYRKVIFNIVKENSEYFIYYGVYMYQKVISYYY